ncbi:VOC family protein [Actinocatenispora thailandica]|nr:VOC family protein [Actinocatenispora thailandica]
MTTRTTPPNGAPCWLDLSTTDEAASRRFYTGLFGWHANEPVAEFGGYSTFDRNGAPVAGLMPAQGDNAGHDGWGIYLAAEDAAATLDAAASNGGTVASPAMRVAELGTMGLVTDPDGALIGVWQPEQHQGFVEYAVDGAPGWFELHTDRYQDVLDFYRTVFGWDTATESDTPQFRYTTMRNGEEQLAGVMDGSGMPDADKGWSVYFAADDVDATGARAVELGARLVRPAEDTPYGRLAVLDDPNGARFKLVGPNNG